MDATSHLKTLLRISGEVAVNTSPHNSKTIFNKKEVLWCGVLPYAIAGGELMVLLGRNKRTRKYAGFGGSPNKGETPVKCASRECYEELKGLLGDKHTVETCLDKENNFSYNKGDEQGETYLFLYKVYYNPEISDRYVNTATFTDETREMTHIRWFTMEELSEKGHMLDKYFIRDLNSGLREFLEKRQVLSSQ